MRIFSAAQPVHDQLHDDDGLYVCRQYQQLGGEPAQRCRLFIDNDHDRGHHHNCGHVDPHTRGNPGISLLARVHSVGDGNHSAKAIPLCS